jgi:hypothetical protein
MYTSEVLISGVLEKRASKPPTRYQKRFFEVTRRYQGRQEEEVVGHYLSYYKDDNKRVLKGTLDLNDLDSIVVNVPLRGIVLHMCFNQKVELRARDESAATAWADGLDELRTAGSRTESGNNEELFSVSRMDKREALQLEREASEEKREQARVEKTKHKRALRQLQQAKMADLQERRAKYDWHFVEMDQRYRPLANSFDGHLRASRAQAFEANLQKAASATSSYRRKYHRMHPTLGISEKGICDFLRRVNWGTYVRKVKRLTGQYSGPAQAGAWTSTQFARANMRREPDGNDMREVIQMFMRESGNEDLSVCELLWNEGSDEVGPADCFLSHVSQVRVGSKC